METVFDALKAMGVASAIELSARTGIHKDHVVNELWDMKREGRVVRHGRSWRVVEVDTDKMPEAEMAEKAPVESVAEVVQSIPSFTEKRPDDFISRSLRRANRELRRKDGEVAKMRQVCEALRVLNRHRDIVQGIFPEG
ncbi:DUF1627 domain-containing protein [Salmonella enterica subsp. enterica]|nr:DUF1627 domain-containing protein [Salmonella enterica subsp. enterica]EEC0437841.1 DUF1627 domain-containing protein [Salmonella enterica subsp. enterica]EHW1157900.1 DUF1627 domain-containing protein [Salmonella enterica subsp. enterica serovar Takoradi]EKR0896831.1 DUF1627 domain-containing protein [Salmonella enterica]